MPILRPPRFRWHLIQRSRMVGSSAATSSCWKRWVVALHGARRRSGIEKVGISGNWRIADGMGFRYECVIETAGARRLRRENRMADLGIARLGKEADAANTLTRADLADVVHRRLG